MELNLNAMLARCNFEGAQERGRLVDALDDAGRLEEWAMLGRAGLVVEWENDLLVADGGSVGVLDDRPVRGRVMVAYCPLHAVGIRYQGQRRIRCDRMPADVRDVVEGLLFARPFRSPVLPFQEGDDGDKVRVRAVPMPGGNRHSYYIAIPDPAAYINRLVNLVRQRAAAGYPIVLPAVAA